MWDCSLSQSSVCVDDLLFTKVASFELSSARFVGHTLFQLSFCTAGFLRYLRKVRAVGVMYGITFLDGHRDMVRCFVNGRSVPLENTKAVGLGFPCWNHVPI